MDKKCVTLTKWAPAHEALNYNCDAKTDVCSPRFRRCPTKQGAELSA